MTRDEARAFAEEWAAAWNERDVERVLSHFDDDISFTSPTALAVVGVASSGSRVVGPRQPGAGDHLRVRYGSTKRVSENLVFGANGLVARAEVFHGVEV